MCSLSSCLTLSFTFLFKNDIGTNFPPRKFRIENSRALYICICMSLSSSLSLIYTYTYIFIPGGTNVLHFKMTKKKRLIMDGLWDNMRHAMRIGYPQYIHICMYIYIYYSLYIRLLHSLLFFSFSLGAVSRKARV